MGSPGGTGEGVEARGETSPESGGDAIRGSPTLRPSQRSVTDQGLEPRRQPEGFVEIVDGAPPQRPTAVELTDVAQQVRPPAL